MEIQIEIVQEGLQEAINGSTRLDLTPLCQKDSFSIIPVGFHSLLPFTVLY